ncbi:MAG: FMN-binding protein [Actinomycetota bacterium]|jgi:uncharacterized protein with FMN-binding domain|nr:FMN-binding protein [Actinomycetota bacterium]
MKRYPAVLAATAAGLAGVLSFHTQRASVLLPRASTSGVSPTSPPPSSRKHATPTSPPARSSPQATTSSATGALEQYGYGQLSVRVTMSGGKITKVAVAKLQTADTYSQQLADYVVPVLEREVLAAQSARIHGLTGATYTSAAYAYSVQSALDKLRR